MKPAVSLLTCLLAIALLFPALSAAQGDRPPLLVDVDWLSQNAESTDLLLLQVDTSADRFTDGHIPGARFLDYTRLVTNVDVPDKGQLITELPPIDSLEAVLREAGVSSASHVVLYGHPVLAARAFFTLEYLGHERVSILDGGFSAWEAAGHSPATGVATGEAGTFTASPRPTLLVDADWVQEHKSRDDYALVDARPIEEYTGEDGGMGGRVKAGHIPGARHLYWEELMVAEDDPRFLERERLSERFERAGVDPGDTMISYCFIGMRASVNYFVSRLLGHPTVFYDGSWNDWSLLDLPVESGPDPGLP